MQYISVQFVNSGKEGGLKIVKLELKNSSLYMEIVIIRMNYN